MFNMSLKDYVSTVKLCRGSFGEVWQCRSKKDGEVFAMEILDSCGKTTSVSEAEQEKLRELRHPHIVHFEASFTVGNVFYIITERCAGGNLADRIERQKLELGHGFHEEQITALLVDVSFGLQFLHSQQIVHRYLNPGCILFTSTNVAKISDVDAIGILGPAGLARNCLASPLLQLYQSPEVVLGEPCAESADVWSLGCCAREMMTLCPAIDEAEFVDEHRHVIRAMPDNYSKCLTLLTERMLNDTPDFRPDVGDILKQAFIHSYIANTLTARIRNYCTLLRDLSEKIRLVAHRLKKLHRQVSKARIATASLGIVLGVVAVAAGVATIATAGAMTPVAVGLTAGTISACASISGLVAQAVKQFRDGIQVKRMNARLDKIRPETSHLLDLLNSIDAVPDLVDEKKSDAIRETVKRLPRELNVRDKPDSRAVGNAVGRTAGTLGACVTTTKSAAKVATIATSAGRGARVGSIVGNAGKGAARFASTAGKLTGSFGIVFGAIGIGIDIWQIVDASMDLAQRNPSAATKNLTKVAETIDTLSSKLSGIWNLTDTCDESADGQTDQLLINDQTRDIHDHLLDSAVPADATAPLVKNCNACVSDS